MRQENIKEIKSNIETCKKKLAELKPYIETDRAMEILYNATLVDKAVLTDKINKAKEKKTIFSRIQKKLRFGKHQKTICDYFMK